MMNTRNTIKAAALVAATLVTFQPATSEARWYIGHMGAEDCVPLDDIGISGGSTTEPDR